LRPLVCPENL